MAPASAGVLTTALVALIAGRRQELMYTVQIHPPRAFFFSFHFRKLRLLPPPDHIRTWQRGTRLVFDPVPGTVEMPLLFIFLFFSLTSECRASEKSQMETKDLCLRLNRYTTNSNVNVLPTASHIPRLPQAPPGRTSP